MEEKKYTAEEVLDLQSAAYQKGYNEGYQLRKQEQQGAVWVKATTRTATHGKQVFAKDGSGRKTVGYFTKSNLASDVIDCFYSMVGSFYIKGEDYESLEWYDDESGQSKEGNKEREIIDELWDEHSALIGDDIDDLSFWSGREVMKKEDFVKAIEQLKKLTP